jgi:hypothetical protein
VGSLHIAHVTKPKDATPDAVKKALSRDKGRMFVCITNTEDGIHRWALLEKRAG